MPLNKQKWADIDENDDIEPTTGAVNIIDEDGIRTAVRYYENAKNETVKETTKSKVHKKVTKVNRAIARRRDLSPFCKGDAGCCEELDKACSIEVPRKARGGVERDDDDESYYFHDLPLKTTTTLKKKFEAFEEAGKDIKKVTITDSMGDNPFMSDKPLDGVDGDKKKYAPPQIRGENRHTRGFQDVHKEEHTVRVTNLSEDVKDNDLAELFGTAGRVARVFLAKHRETKSSKGFAFITYYSQKEAASAIQKLNRHGYDNLILNVEWAKPSTKERDRG